MQLFKVLYGIWLTLYGVNGNIVCMTNWTPLLDGLEGPLYMAVADAMERDVYAGVLRPGQKLPTHRDMADALGINVSTVTRAYAEAERRGLVSATVGRGTYVSSDATTSTAMVSFEPTAPGLIEMGSIAPFYGLDPDMGAALRRLAGRRDPNVFLRYSDPRGLPEHREVGATWARAHGLEADPANVLICAGAQHALTCALSTLFRPGDHIAADRLTYPGFKAQAMTHGLRLVPVDMDAEGMTPESLDAACRRDDVRGIYLMPGVQNPTTCRMSQQRRQEIADVARRYGLLVVEDDAYDLTSPERMRPVSSLLPESSLHISGLSKSLAAGLRVAFVTVPERFRIPVAQTILNSIWMVPPLNVELVAGWISDGTAMRVVRAKRAEAARRYALAREVLSPHCVQGRDTGFFLWLSLPEGWTGNGFEAASKLAGVNVFGAERFVVGEAPAPAAVRVALSAAADRQELRRGLELLKGVMEQAPTPPSHGRKRT